MTLSSFVPEDQDKKRALIAQAATGLDRSAESQGNATRRPPIRSIIASLEATSNYHEHCREAKPGSKRRESRRAPSRALADLAKASPEARARRRMRLCGR